MVGGPPRKVNGKTGLWTRVARLVMTVVRLSMTWGSSLHRRDWLMAWSAVQTDRVPAPRKNLPPTGIPRPPSALKQSSFQT